MMEPAEDELSDVALTEVRSLIDDSGPITTSVSYPSVVEDESANQALIDNANPILFLKSIITECLCEQFAPGHGDGEKGFGFAEREQIVEIHGIEFIGLGAITNELSAKERVYDTLEQLSSRTERLISIGYLTPDNQGKKKTDTIPLDVWKQNYPDDKPSRPIRKIIKRIQSGNLEDAMREVHKQYVGQKRRGMKQNNFFKLGISAHNLGVLSFLAGHELESLACFQEAVACKKKAFGIEHLEVAVSLDQLGIQLFANERYKEALAAFVESKNILQKNNRSSCMLQNNIACCHFLMGNLEEASGMMEQALELQTHTNNSNPPQSDLDLLQMVFVLNNYGYLKVSQKQYDEASKHFEQATSILGDAHNHRAIRDSQSNLDYTRAYHS